MTKNSDQYSKETVNKILFDYTRYFCENFKNRAHGEVSRHVIMDFISKWVDDRFKDDEGKDA